MNKERKIMFAVFAAGLMLCAPLAVTMADEEKETDAIAPLVILGVGILLGVVISIEAYTLYERFFNPLDGNDDLARQNEAKAMNDAMKAATNQIDQAFSTYPGLWDLTADHWIRQSELAAAAVWSSGTEYDPNLILASSGEYRNASAMLANAGNHTAILFGDINSRTTKWQDKGYYKDGNLELTVSIGGKSITATGADTIRAITGTVARDVESGNQAVYYAGGPIYSSKDTTLTSLNGYKLILKEGWNDIENVNDFKHPDVYYLTPGASFCGPFMSVIDTQAAPLYAGTAFLKNSECLLVSYNGSTFSTDGKDSIQATDDALQISATTKGLEADPVQYAPALMEYGRLFKTVKEVQSKANLSAKTVWRIYSDLGASTAALTTLSLKNNYADMEWTEDQLRMVTYMMMNEIRNYWNANEDKLDDEKKTFDMTSDSMSLMCRGGVKIEEGAFKGYDLKGVAFTPFFYQDTTIKKGVSSTSGYCYIIVWGECLSLEGFTSTSLDKASILFAPKGAILNISEMKLGNEYKDELFLKSKKIEWVDPHHQDWDEPQPYKEADKLVSTIQLILVILGGALVVFGFGRGNYVTGIIGVVIVAAGMLFAGTIADAVRTAMDWGKLWPF